MDTSRVEHRTAIHEARNSLGDVISRARYAGESTILTNRGKEAAVIVSYDFYEQAKKDRHALDSLKAAIAGLPDGEKHPFLIRWYEQMTGTKISD